MPTTQGKYPAIFLKGQMCGDDDNLSPTTTNSHEYRGKPYTLANKIDQTAFDFTREQAKISWQMGLKVVALYCTTSQNPIR